MSFHEDFSRNRAWRQGPGVPDGTDSEAALLGSPRLDRKERVVDYMEFDKALDFVKQHQPNPLERSRAVQNLCTKVAEQCFDTRTAVKFFTAIGTPLDTYHGVDGFFEQGGRVATIDVSLREKEITKADVLIHMTLDDAGVVHVSDAEMEHAAKRIADILNAPANRMAA